MRPLQAFGVALGVCGIAGTCILYVTRSTAQSVKESPAQGESNASPIYGVTIPAGYRDWRLISVKRLTGAEGKLRQLRAQLGNDLAITAFRERTLRFPDGASLPRCTGVKPHQMQTIKS